MEEAEKEFRFNPKYQNEREEVFRYEQELRSMGLSKEVITVIDKYLSSLNAEWLRYGELRKVINRIRTGRWGEWDDLITEIDGQDRNGHL